MRIIHCTKEKLEFDDDRDEVCDRHIRLFGKGLQVNLSSMNIGIVGAGGLGSVLIEQLMRLYPDKMTIIDKDFVELTNLNRLTNATYEDAHNKIPKVEVARKSILSFNPNQKAQFIIGDFLEKENQEKFKECDFIFGGLDSIGVRFAINQLSIAHGIPYLDCGTGVIIKNNQLKHVGGQVISIMPDSGICLYCADLFNKQEAMDELLDDEEHSRQENMGYIRGADIIAPQVYALNMQVASTAVWLFMRIISGERFTFDGIAIDAKAFSLYPWKNEDHDNKDCPICGENGITFKGDDADLLCKENKKPEIILDNIKIQPIYKIIERVLLDYEREIIPELSYINFSADNNYPFNRILS